MNCIKWKYIKYYYLKFVLKHVIGLNLLFKFIFHHLVFICLVFPSYHLCEDWFPIIFTFTVLFTLPPGRMFQFFKIQKGQIAAQTLCNRTRRGQCFPSGHNPQVAVVEQLETL